MRSWMHRRELYHLDREECICWKGVILEISRLAAKLYIDSIDDYIGVPSKGMEMKA